MATKKKEAPELIDTQPHDYEMVFVISPEVGEEALDSVIDGVNKSITSKKGVISEVEKWGRRKLAYPIKRFGEGNYVLMRFKMSPEQSKELEASLHISEEVLRHLLIRLDNVADSAKPAEA
ncbi:30S ribosomal protein S6 [Chloroflexota bacterium]